MQLETFGVLKQGPSRRELGGVTLSRIIKDRVFNTIESLVLSIYFVMYVIGLTWHLFAKKILFVIADCK